MWSNHSCEFVDSDLDTGDWITCCETATEPGHWYPEDPFNRYCAKHAIRTVRVAAIRSCSRHYLKGDAATVRQLRIKLMVHAGMTRVEISREIGLSYKYVCLLARRPFT